MKKAIFDWLCSLIITGDIYLLIILPFVGLFIFLIGDNKIKTIEDLENWTSKRTKVKGSTLLKIMSTMKERYGVRFIIVPKKEIGKQVLKLLEVK